jgi:FixJ family two-component response regulator
MAVSGRILIADDEETFLLATAERLRREGYDCACAPDAGTAAAMLRCEEHDLLIADVRMPGNTELELIRNCTCIAPGVAGIMVTGYPSVHSAIEAIRLPVVAYLVKPLDFAELLSHVRPAIEHSRTYRAVCGADQRLEEWRREVEGLKERMRVVRGDPSTASPGAFFPLTLGHIVRTLLDLMRWTEAIDLQEEGPDVGQLLASPHLTPVREALTEAISVLERTKGAFKSKELGEIRKKLEGLVSAG